MADVIVAFLKLDNGKQLGAQLKKRGHNVFSICRSGNFVLNSADRLGAGIIVCQDKLSDMVFSEMYESIPRTYQIVLIKRNDSFEDDFPADKVKCLISPVRLTEILDSVDEMERIKEERKVTRRPRVRTIEDERIIEGAKLLLINKKGMTEPQAHKYLTSMSMNNGETLRETAEKIKILFQSGGI